jgi:hypothetical protein
VGASWTGEGGGERWHSSPLTNEGGGGGVFVCTSKGKGQVRPFLS